MKHHGFTLIELVLVIALTGILAIVVAPVLNGVTKGFNLVSSRRMAVAEARAGMDRMVREIRLIPSSAQVITVSASNFQFQYPAGTAITYSLSGTNLLRNSDILVSGVSSLTFTYYNETGTTTSTRANIRSVGIQFTRSTPYTLRTRVFLRNTGNNYANFTSP